jgi:hypothetical protein
MPAPTNRKKSPRANLRWNSVVSDSRSQLVVFTTDTCCLAAEIVGARDAADEDVLGGVEAGAQRLNRQFRALSIRLISYGLGSAAPERAIATASITANDTISVSIV